MTSGSTAYSRLKDQQDSSMPSKQEPSEDVYDVVLQGPRDRARAALPEPQTPAREEHLPRLQRLQRGHRYTADHVSPSEPSGRWAMGDQPIQRTAQVKGSNGAPTSRSDVHRFGNAGWPTGRESYGHGAPVIGLLLGSGTVALLAIGLVTVGTVPVGCEAGVATSANASPPTPPAAAA